MKKFLSLLLTVIAIFAGIFAAYLFLSYSTSDSSKKQNTHLKNSIGDLSKPESTFTDKNKKVLLKKPDGDFNPPIPGPKEYKLVYPEEGDVDETETINRPIISAVELPPASDNQEIDTPKAIETAYIDLVEDSTKLSSSKSNKSQSNDDKTEPEFFAEDLAELESFGAEVYQGGLIGGAHVELEDSFENLDTPVPTPTPEPTANPEEDEKWFVGQIRGYAILYLMQPSARVAVNRQIEILKKSRVKNVYIGVLADGTFSIDYSYLNAVLRDLHTHGANITLALYLSNGPGMRNSEERERYSGTINQYEPEKFRTLIRNDQSVRAKFASIARRAKQAFEFNRRLSNNNQNIAHVMLEDNLDFESYQSMRDVAAAELDNLARFIRNPCPGCYEGNDFEPGDDGLEFHDPQLIHALRRSDGFSMDGKGLFFPGEFDPTGLSVDDTRTVITASLTQGVQYFALWRAARQGISSENRAAPDDRIYEIPTETHEQFEIELLRHGLTEEGSQSPEGVVQTDDFPEEIFK